MAITVTLWRLACALALIATACTPTTDATTTTSTSSPPPVDTSIGDPYYPGLGNGGYDVDHYTLDLRYEPAAGTLDATASIQARALGDLNRFSLDFGEMTVTSVTVDGEPAAADSEPGELIVTPQIPIDEGHDFVVEVSYEGAPRGEPSEAIDFLVGWRTAPSGTAFAVGEPDGAHRWYPVNDHPRDKATYTFRITVPNGQFAAANGVLAQALTDDERTTYVWEARDPLASYLVIVVIGAFRLVEREPIGEITIRDVLPRDIADEPLISSDIHATMIDYFESFFGPYPFEAYGVVAVDGFETALETQTLSLLDRRLLDTNVIESVLVHELAHQWFGNHVSPESWSDVWLNEGFATFAEALWDERIVGEAAVNRRFVAMRDVAVQAAQLPPGSPPAEDLFNPGVYTRGALTLHALRRTVGDNTFFAILREYLERFGGGVAGTDDFIDTAEAVSEQSLRPLLESFLFDSEVPALP